MPVGLSATVYAATDGMVMHVQDILTGAVRRLVGGSVAVDVC